MQIFSKLQRNSTYYIIVILIVLFINSLNSSFWFFPVLLGFFLFCGDYFLGLVFLVFFCILHSYSLLLFFVFYIIYRTLIIKKIYEYIDKQYFDVVNLFVIYLFLYLYLLGFINIKLDFIYTVYNFSFDLLLIRIIKCEPELYY